MIWNISKKVNGRIAVWSMLKLYLAVACDMHAIPLRVLRQAWWNDMPELLFLDSSQSQQSLRTEIDSHQ
jgi:hypothetical protein